MKVDRYVEPEEFAKWKEVAEGMGFLYVASGPLVRSSYKVRQSLLPNGQMTDVLFVCLFFRLVNSLSKMYLKNDVQLLPSTLLPNCLPSHHPRSLPKCNTPVCITYE